MVAESVTPSSGTNRNYTPRTDLARVNQSSTQLAAFSQRTMNTTNTFINVSTIHRSMSWNYHQKRTKKRRGNGSIKSILVCASWMTSCYACGFTAAKEMRQQTEQTTEIFMKKKGKKKKETRFAQSVTNHFFSVVFCALLIARRFSRCMKVVLYK